MASRLPARARTGPVRPRVNADENTANVGHAATHKHLRQASAVGPVRVPVKGGPQRPVLTEVTTTAVNKIASNLRAAGKNIATKEDVTSLKRGRSSSVSNAPTGPQRVPLGVKTNGSTVTTTVHNLPPSTAPLRPQRPSSLLRQSETAPELAKVAAPSIPLEVEEEDVDMDVEEEAEIVNEVAMPHAKPDLEDDEDELDDEDDGTVVDETEKVSVAQIWPQLTPRAAEKYKKEIELIRASFQDDVDSNDMTMVHEYAEEIFEYMHKLEVEIMPSPDYMQGQSELDPGMRQTLVDWLLQVHLRYHLLPETLWIAVNIVDRFLSKRVVSIVKLQLVGVTALFIASKYEEIMAPSAEEMVLITDGGYTKDEIIKGERIMLASLDFQVSGYCSPYSWMRKISKADDYDIQTRTLCKFLVEVTLLDYRFLRVKPSLVAAVGMYTARQMLGGDWNEAFVFYSGYTEEHLMHGHRLIVEKLQEPGFHRLGVTKKYMNKKFLKASTYAITWARHQLNVGVDSDGEDMFLDD